MTWLVTNKKTMTKTNTEPKTIVKKFGEQQSKRLVNIEMWDTHYISWHVGNAHWASAIRCFHFYDLLENPQISSILKEILSTNTKFHKLEINMCSANSFSHSWQCPDDKLTTHIGGSAQLRLKLGAGFPDLASHLLSWYHQEGHTLTDTRFHLLDHSWLIISSYHCWRLKDEDSKIKSTLNADERREWWLQKIRGKVVLWR